MSRNSCDVNFSNSTKNVANKGGGIRKSSGADQDGFSDENQIVAPSCTGAYSAPDSDTAAVKEGCEVKARTDSKVIMPCDREYASMFGKPNSMGVARSETQQVLRAPRPPCHQFVTDEVVSDEDYRDTRVLRMMRANWRKGSDSCLTIFPSSRLGQHVGSSPYNE